MIFFDLFKILIYLCEVKKYIFIVALMMLVKPVIPVFQYAFDYKYISEVLCINKEKPELHCNGKCHLMKELAKASESEKPISSDKKSHNVEFEILFFEKLDSFEIEVASFQPQESVNSNYSNLYSRLNCSPIFHPPLFIS